MTSCEARHTYLIDNYLFNINMAKDNPYHIINRITRVEKYHSNYDECLEFYNNQDKTYRKLHRIIDNREFNKIIKRRESL